MAVERLSQALNLDVGGNGAIQQSQTGIKRADVDKYATQHNTEATDAPDASMDRILGTIGAQVTDFGGKVFKAGTEEAYLQGVAQAGTKSNEADLASDPLTSDWTKAGYRDTMGRLKSADLESQIASDMIKMREKSPQEFADYIAQKRTEILPQLEGMSKAARGSLLAQVMLSERAAIKTHGKENAKFIIETVEKGVKASINSSMNLLDDAKNQPEDVYKDRTTATFGAANQAIMANPNLPQANKVEFVKQLAGYALSNDHLQLYDMIKRTNVPMGDGTQRPMMSLLGFDDEAKLNADHRASMERTDVFRSNEYTQQKAQMMATFGDKNAPILPWEQVNGFIEKGKRDGFIKTRAEASGILDAYYSHAASKEGLFRKANAFANGDMTAMLKEGSDVSGTMDAWVTVNAQKGATAPQISDGLMALGASKGMPQAFKKAAEIMGPALTQLGDVDHVNLENAVMAKGMLDKVEAAEKAGATGAMEHFLSGLPENQRTKLIRMQSLIKSGVTDPATAAKKALQMEVQESQMNPQQRAAVAGQNAKDDVDEVAKLTPQTWWGRTKGFVHGLIPTQGGKEAANEQGALPQATFWGEDSKPAREQASEYRRLVLEGAGRARIDSPYLTSSEAVQAAKSDIANRTIPTKNGPLFLPYGTDIGKKFSVNQTMGNVGNERIGAALDELYKPKEGNSTRMYLDLNGDLTVEEYNKQNQRVTSPQKLDASAVGAKVDEMRTREAERYAAIKGPGIERKDANTGLGVTFSGANTVGVSNERMYAFRENLVKHEGVVDKAAPDVGGGKHPDGSPIMTTGVGLSSTNSFYPKPDANGKITREQSDVSFKMASNEAAGVATKVIAATGLPTTGPRGEAAFKLVAELAYQSGGTGAFNKPAWANTVKAIQAQDYDAAVAAFKQHSVLTWGGKDQSGTPRGRDYLDLLKQLMKG